MTVRELNKDQLEELKQNYVFETMENPSYGDLAESYSIADEVIYNYYDGVYFVNDDFCCSCGK
jgi:hypothetical protein